MSIWEAIFLGVVQGLTEFLPVSSSGHLVLFSNLLQVNEPSVVFEVLVHVGTLGAVLIVFWQDVLVVINAFFKLLRRPVDIKRLYYEDSGCRLLLQLIAATLPTVVLALLFKDLIESLFTSTLLVGFMLIITGIILYVSHRSGARGKELRQGSIFDAIVVGIGQAFAIIPGVSRSGTTIAVGILRGFNRETAARFSFLLSIPAIIGALVLSLGDLISGTVQVPGSVLLAGMIAAGITGYLAIKLMLQFVREGRLVWFSYYTWVVGVLIVILSLI